MTIVITCLALLGAMQAMAVNYPQMKPARPTYGQPMHVTAATAPTATFHSTSPMAGTYSGVSTLNALIPMAIVLFSVGLIKGICHVFNHF